MRATKPILYSSTNIKRKTFRKTMKVRILLRAVFRTYQTCKMELFTKIINF